MTSNTMPTPVVAPWWVIQEDDIGEGVPSIEISEGANPNGPLQGVCQVEPEWINDAPVLTPRCWEKAALIAAAGTAASEVADMGYDPVEAVRALPELLRGVEELRSQADDGAYPYSTDACACEVCRSAINDTTKLLRRAAGKEGDDGGA